ncbi:hypothetical protein EV702DRAFT_1045344 [Suillus placidus]|uniref:Uncharacterized protein n=1 Tax=Suillus placidus TaxID=48579 RepID=A0A9P7D3C8_9AGAM|nr:hypothetical protein EV702DRAFT_1045344 [Suillus placidus]
MSRTTINNIPSVEKTTVFQPAFMDALLECSSGPTSRSLVPTIHVSGTPKSAVNNGSTPMDALSASCFLLSLSYMEALEVRSILLSSYSETGCQPVIKDIRTVKAQFQLQTLDDSFPPEAVMCSKKAANTLLYLASNCEKNRDGVCETDNRVTDELDFVVHSDALFPEASESRGDVVPEFSLEDFENTDFTLTGDVLKDRFTLKKTAGGEEVGMPKGVHNWTLKDLEDPQGHFKMVIDLYKLEKVPVVVPNVQDAAGNLIHPSEYSKHFTEVMPVAAEVVMRLQDQHWTPNQRLEACRQTPRANERPMVQQVVDLQQRRLLASKRW